MANNTTRVDLNIYLIKDGVSLSQAVKKKNVSQIPLHYEEKSVGTLHVKSTKSNQPKWTRFFDGLVVAHVFGKNSSTAALLVVMAEGRAFGLAFGQGRYLLHPEHVEHNFGLRVTLNSVDENSLRSIDKASFEEQPKHSREQTGKAAGLPSFVVDVERDLLRAVTGKPTDSYFGERISGMDSVKLSIDMHISSVPQLLHRLLKQYSADNYKKKGFSFVDHIGEVRDSALVDALDDQLIANINAKKTEKVWLAVPELVDWDRAVGFRYSSASSAVRYYDVKLSDFVESLQVKELQKQSLLTRKIYCVDADDLSVFERPAYYYVYAEQEHKKRTYVLNNGKWYLIERDFVSDVNEFYKNVPRYKSTLPSFGETDNTEGDYNSRVAKEAPEEFALLDKLLITLPGALAPVEACDLYRKPRQFIHVKRYGGSSLLSHLFNQGTVSAELFRGDVRFRKDLNKRLPSRHKIKGIEEVPSPNEYKIVYAVISEYEEDLSIPFFSKISLRHAVNRLATLGYAVELAKVSVTPVKKVLQIVPAHGSKKKASPKAVAA